jgi:transposase
VHQEGKIGSTWALEVGDVTRFTSIKQAISYCSLCGDEKSSAEKVLRMPIFKQRNKHIQRVLIEAAKLATRESPDLAMIRARELEKGNPNRATLAVARKMVITYSPWPVNGAQLRYHEAKARKSASETIFLGSRRTKPHLSIV